MSVETVPEEFAVAPPGKAARVFIGLFTVVIPLVLLVVMAAFPEHRPPPAGLAVALLAIVSVAALLLVATRRRSIRLDEDRLEVKAAFYVRSIALASIDVDAARVVDLREHPESRPLLKTNGFAVPGLMFGNFRDRKRHKLFCLVTAPRVVVLPLRDDTRMLLSPAQPGRLLERIRARARRAWTG